MSSEIVLNSLETLTTIFEKRLAADQQASVSAIVGDARVQIHQVSKEGDELLVLHGVDSGGREVMVVQHHSQVNLLFSVLPRACDGDTRLLRFKDDEAKETAD